ncbi:major coat protein [Zhongshania marina]|uniref:Phage coat protein n=1 Tax=Zhongshania marina TaxID=2304603 RepID=A0ABX9W6C1_9GAMM|nr:phage coat protein [Zhongshania marina]
MQKLSSKLAVLTALTVGVVASAHAELPAAATTALTSINTGITDASDAAWPLIGAALVAGVLIKLVKRFTNKV